MKTANFDSYSDLCSKNKIGLSITQGGGGLLKSLPFLLFFLPVTALFGDDTSTTPIGTTACKAGDFCASVQNQKNPTSIYLTPDKKNVQLKIKNPVPLKDDLYTPMLVQVYGKDVNNRINVSGDIYHNFKVPATKFEKSLISVDMKNANYNGNIFLKRDFEDPTDKDYNRIGASASKFSFDHSTINGNIHLENYPYPSGINFTSSTLNGNLYIKSQSDGGSNLTLSNSTFNGDITWIYNVPISLSSQYFYFQDSTFNNSNIYLGVDKSIDISKLFALNYYGSMNNNTFNNVTLNFDFPTTNILTFNNNTFNGGKIILNNKDINGSRGSGSGFNNYFTSSGSHIRADIIINGDGQKILKNTTYSDEKTDTRPDKEKYSYTDNIQQIYDYQKSIPCPAGVEGQCYTDYDSTKQANAKPLKGPDGKIVQGHLRQYKPIVTITSTITQLGMDFTFQKLAATDSTNHTGADITSVFEGNISLQGGNNNFIIKDASILKNGRLNLDGGNNTFTITDNSSFDDFDIFVNRLIKRKSDIPTEDLPNWTCSDGESLCYQDSSNKFTITNSSLKNTSFEILGGKTNEFNLTDTKFIGGDINLLGGLKNTLTFTNSPKIGGNILISGGEENILSFTKDKLSDETAKWIGTSVAPVATTNNPFDPAQMTKVKAAIITSQVTPTLIKALNNITPDLFSGDITLGSSSSADTNNKMTFKNGLVSGDLKIINGNAQNTRKVSTTITMSNNLFLGDIIAYGSGMSTATSLVDSAMIGDISTYNGINYTSLQNSQMYGDIITNGGVNVTQISNGSVFAGSMETYNGKNFIDLNGSLYTNPYNSISHINTYNGESNITLSINATIAAVLTSQKIYPVFHIGNYNGGTANIAVEGPVSGTAKVNYSGGTANIIFADGITGSFFAGACSPSAGGIGVLDQACIDSAKAQIDGKKQIFKINGYTYSDGLAIRLDAQKADKILAPFRDIYKDNYASIFLDKSGVSATGNKDGIYRMKIDGIVVGAEYNLPSTSNKQYEVTFGENSAFIGDMFAKTDNTNFILSQGSKLILNGGSQSVISTLTANNEGFKANIDTMFDSTLAQKTNTIIDLATGGEQATRAFSKNTFSTMHIMELDNFNDAIFRVGIDASKTDTNLNINSIPQNTDRIIISDVVKGQHLSDYLQVYQDYNHLITGDLSNKNILVAVVENSPKPNTTMVFDTSASNVSQGYDQVTTILTSRPIKVDKGDGSGKAGTGNVDINPADKTGNAMGYFIQSASTKVDPRNLANTNSAITSNYSIFLANINNLNKRMGELRDNSYAQGAWSRVFSGLNSSARGDESKIYSNNIQFGYDYGWNTSVGEQFLGGAFTYGYDTIKGNAYNGSANLFEFAGYYSWVGDEGFYTDTILKYTYIRNRISIKDNANFSVPLNSNGLSVGQEVGYRYYGGQDKKFYIEPSVEVILGMMNGGYVNQISQSGIYDGSDFVPTLNANLNYIFNFRGKVGANFGYRLKTDKNQTDFRVGAFYVADIVNGGVINYTTNYSSAQTLIEPNQQLMFNLGVNSVVSENWRVYADVDSGILGQYFNQTYLVSVGLRYEFGHPLNPLAAQLAEEKRVANIKLYTQRLDEDIANVQLKQDRIRQSELFDMKKADITNTPEAQLKANISIRKKERDLDSAKFKTLTLAIAKVINEASPTSELERFQAQENKVLEDAKNRVRKNIQGDSDINRKNTAQKHAKQTKDLQTKQPIDLKNLQDKQAKNKQDMQDMQDKNKKAYVEKQAKDKDAFLKAQEVALKKAKATEKAKLEAQQAKDLKQFNDRQARDMKMLTDRLANDLKRLETKQAKTIENLKKAQEKQAKDLKERQDKENKDVEEFIIGQEKESNAYLEKITQELEVRQTKAKKDLQDAQRKALAMRIKNGISKLISDDELNKLHMQEEAQLKEMQKEAGKELKEKENKSEAKLKEKQAKDLKEFVDNQNKQKQQMSEKQTQTKQKFSTNEEAALKKAKAPEKAKLEAKQKKELQDLNAALAKQAKEFEIKQAKALKEFKAKQAKEEKALQDRLTKEQKANELYWTKAAKELKEKQAKDKKELASERKNPKFAKSKNTDKTEDTKDHKQPLNKKK